MKLKITALLIFIVQWAQAQTFYNVTDFGAKGDGKTINTKALQKAIDKCNADGGGRVVFPTGTFITGTIHLKSNVELYLTATAIIKGVADMKQYPPVPSGKRSSLIHAFEQHNIAILGPGKIDGSGDAPVFQGGGKHDGIEGRPFAVHFRKCTDVRLKEFTAINAAFWTLKMEENDRTNVDGIKVISRIVANNDGIDIVDCHNTIIANSYFDCGDDAICPKSDNLTGVKNLVITNCIIKSESNGIKFGTSGLGGFEDVTISNCVITDTRLSGIAIQMVDGGKINRLSINNIVMHNVNGSIAIKLGKRRGRTGSLKNISISDVTADGIGAWRPDKTQAYFKETVDPRVGIVITGLPNNPIENVSFSNIKLQFYGGGKVEDADRIMADLPSTYPEYSNYGVTPAYGFNCRHVNNISFNNVTLDYVNQDARPAMFFDFVNGLEINNLKAKADASARAFVGLQNVADVFIHNSKAAAVPIPFLHIAGNAIDLTIINNDFHKIKSVFNRAPNAVITEVNVQNNLHTQTEK